MPAPANEENVRTEILAAGRKLFQQYGLRKTTMQDIARAVGKSKSSLYYYFASKEALFEELVESAMRETLAEVAQAVAAAPTTADKLATFGLTWLRKLRQQAALNDLLAREVLYNGQLVQAIRQRHRQQQQDLLRQVLATDPTLDLPAADLDALLFILLSGLYGLEQELLLRPTSRALEAMLHRLAQAMVQSLTSSAN